MTRGTCRRDACERTPDVRGGLCERCQSIKRRQEPNPETVMDGKGPRAP